MTGKRKKVHKLTDDSTRNDSYKEEDMDHKIAQYGRYKTMLVNYIRWRDKVGWIGKYV